MRGRRAALPGGGYQPPVRLLLDDGRCVARFTTEDGRAGKDFDFARLPVRRPLQIAFAEAFDRRTGPAGTCKTLSSATGCYERLRKFAAFLSELADPPSDPGEVTVAHLNGYIERHRHQRGFAQALGALKLTLRAVTGWSDPFAAVLREPGLARDRSPTVRSYSRSELRRILAAARDDVRGVGERIRTHRRLLERWRAGEMDRDADGRTWELG